MADAFRSQGTKEAKPDGGESEHTEQAKHSTSDKPTGGVLVEVGAEKADTGANDDFKQLVRDITLQIAAGNPVCIFRDQVPAPLLARERAIYADQVPAGKPANIIEKIVDGRMGKFYSTHCQFEQAFIKNPDQTITQLIEEKNKALGEKITIRRIVRYMVGEEIAAS